jgi:hypothetical protein
MVTVSWETKPSRDPDPYRMAKSVPLALYEEDEEESYFEWS